MKQIPIKLKFFFNKYKKKNMTKTEENLKLAFASESQANQRYRAFARRAKKEGFPNIARLFKLSSAVESIQAQSDLKELKGVGSTLDNLKTVIAKEKNENKTMYPSMLKQAESDNHKSKYRLECSIKSREAHAQLYFTALVGLKNGNDLSNGELYFCPFCGNIVSEKPDKNCTICSGPAARFFKV